MKNFKKIQNSKFKNQKKSKNSKHFSKNSKKWGYPPVNRPSKYPEVLGPLFTPMKGGGYPPPRKQPSTLIPAYVPDS